MVCMLDSYSLAVLYVQIEFVLMSASCYGLQNLVRVCQCYRIIEKPTVNIWWIQPNHMCSINMWQPDSLGN